MSTYNDSDKWQVMPSRSRRLSRTTHEDSGSTIRNFNARERWSRESGADGRYITQGSIVGSVVSHKDKGRTDTGPKNYKLGDIICVPQITPNLNAQARLGDRDIGVIEATGPVSGKLRPAIVVGIYRNSMLCLPTYTSGGRGYSRAIGEDVLLLRNWNDTGPDWVGSTEHEYVLVEPGTYNAISSQYIVLTEAVAVKYQYPIRAMGRLTNASWTRLKKFWTITVEKGFLDVEAQKAYADSHIRNIKIVREIARIREAMEQRRDKDTNKGGAESKR